MNSPAARSATLDSDHISSINSPFQLRVNTVHEKGTVRYTQQDSLDEAGGEIPFILPSRGTHVGRFSGGNLNAASRQALMQKLARIEPSQSRPEPV